MFNYLKSYFQLNTLIRFEEYYKRLTGNISAHDKLLVTPSNCTLGGQVLESVTNQVKLQVNRYFMLTFSSSFLSPITKKQGMKPNKFTNIYHYQMRHSMLHDQHCTVPNFGHKWQDKELWKFNAIQGCIVFLRSMWQCWNKAKQTINTQSLFEQQFKFDVEQISEHAEGHLIMCVTGTGKQAQCQWLIASLFHFHSDIYAIDCNYTCR